MGSAQRGEALWRPGFHLRCREAGREDRRHARAGRRPKIDYEKLKNQIEETNLSSVELQATLEGKPDAVAKTRLRTLKARYPDFPARQEAIDNFVKAWDAYSGVKGQLDDAGELKRLLKGSGVLEFHILVQDADLQGPEAIAMIERLKPGGKGITPQAGDDDALVPGRSSRGDAGGFYLRDYNDQQIRPGLDHS